MMSFNQILNDCANNGLLNSNLVAELSAAHERECGNAAKLREALEAIVDCGKRYDYDLQQSPFWEPSSGAFYLGDAVDIALAALAETTKGGAK